MIPIPSGVIRCVQVCVCVLPAQTPHQSQVVFSSRNKMAAVVCELQTGDVLIVTTEDRQQLTCGHLNQSENRRYTPEPIREQFVWE